MARNYKIFGDKLVPGVEDYALSGVRAACSIVEPKTSEYIWRISRAVAEAPIIPGKRVWYRIPHPGDYDSFISIHPGEYRITRPADQRDLILELPKVPPEDTLGMRLAAALEYCRNFSFDRQELEHLAKKLDDFTAGRELSAHDMQDFQEADHLTRTGKGSRNELAQKLFAHALLEHKVPLFEFSTAMTLFQLQAMMGMWIEEKRSWLFRKRDSAYANSFQSLWNYVHTLAGSARRSDLVKQLAEIGNVNYIDAGASIKRALNSDSLVASTRALVVGAHQYLIALTVSTLAEKENLTLPLVYKSVQADEGYACTQTGLLEPMSFLFKDPYSEPARISQLLASNVDEQDILSNISTRLWPCFTKRFARTLIATARTLLPSPFLEKGLNDLHILEREYGEILLNVNFERGWIDSALLNVYRRKGDAEQAKLYATRIAGQVIVKRVLAGRPADPTRS